MKLLQFYLIGILIVLYANYNKGQLLLEGSANRVTECEGTELRGSCPPNQVIAVKDIQYGTTNCALNSEAPGCCDYDPTDCLIDYTGTAQQAACSGRGLCDDVIIGEEDTSSCGSPYPDLNHYLTMEYYCIPETRIGLITSADLQETGELLYLQNSDYPNAPIRAAVTTALCSVETTSCSSQVNVYFVHFELADGGGSCTDTQNLQVDDKGVTHTYTCSDNTYYTINLKLTSASNYLKVTLNNPDGTNEGKFVIGFAATDSTSPLEVSCPAKEQTNCGDCPVLTPPSSGSLSTTDVTTGTSVDISCNSGHTLFGEVTFDCQTNGTWSAEVGTCLRDCPILTPPSSGSLSTTDVTTGTSVDVSCDSGHTLFGEVTLDCQSNGTWSAEVGTCLRDCPILTPPSSGSLSTTDVTTGTSVDVSCDSGHTLFGEITLDCQSNGTWSAEVGTCLQDCPVLTPPSSGSLSTTGVTTGTSVDVTCNSGHTLFGEVTLDCQANGTWSADVGTCLPDCPVLTPPSSGSLSTTGVTTGTSVDVSCNSGHTLFGEVTLDCQSNGTWSAEVGTCLRDCPILTPPSSGSLSTTDVTTGTSVDISCDSGHTLFGEITLDCQSNGTWSAEVGTCLQDCPVLTPPSSGSLSTTGVTTGTSVDVTCNSGHTLFGEVTLDCQANGTWSADVGTCLPGLGDSCSSPDDCSAVADATCINNACTCVDGYIENNNECTAVSTGGLGDSCSSPSDCSAVADATCINNVCTCVDGYTESNNACTIASSGGLGDSCTIPSDCSAVEDATCINNVCACVDGYTESNNACTAASSGGQRGLSIGVIVGIVVGALVFALSFCLVIFCFWKRAQPSQKEERHSVENGAISSKSADNSPNGLLPTKSDDNPLGEIQELSQLEKERVHTEKQIYDVNMVTYDETHKIVENMFPDNEASLDIVFRPTQIPSCDLNEIQVPERASQYNMYRDDTAYASSLSCLTMENGIPDKTNEENKIPHETLEKEEHVTRFEAPKSNQITTPDTAMDYRGSVIPNETFMNEEMLKRDDTFVVEKSLFPSKTIQSEEVPPDDMLKNDENVIPDKASKENRTTTDTLENEDVTNFKTPVSNQIPTPDKALEYRGPVLPNETTMNKETLKSDETFKAEKFQAEKSVLSDNMLQTEEMTPDDTLNNKETNLIPDEIQKTVDKGILSKTHQNEDSSTLDGPLKHSGKEMPDETLRYAAIVIPVVTPQTEDRSKPVIASPRDQPSRQPPSLTTESPDNEVLLTAQVKEPVRVLETHQEKIDRGRPPLDTVFRPPQFIPCDLNNIHMPERTTPNLIYQDDGGYLSIADTEFRPPQFTPCSFNDIHIPERASPDHMYRDDSAYDSFVESLTPVETT